MQLKLDMSCRLLNVYTKFQIDISKHVEEKSGKHGRTDGRTDGRTLPRHNTSRFSNGRIKNTPQNVDVLSSMSNLQPNWCLIDFQKVDQHAGGKWLIHVTKRRKDNQLQSLKLPCRMSKLSS